MPEFTNISDLARHIAGTQFLSSGNMEQKLTEEAIRLEGYLKEEINNYYKSYTPKVYVRTYDWINSVRVSKPELNGTTMSIRTYFDDSMSYHPSVISDNQPMGFVPWLMESGWSISQNVQPRRYGFTDNKSTHYISNAVARYNANNPFGFRVTVETGYGEYNHSNL